MKFAVGMIVLVGKDVNLMGVIIAREQVDPAMNLEKVPPLWHYAIYCIDEKVYGATEGTNGFSYKNSVISAIHMCIIQSFKNIYFRRHIQDSHGFIKKDQMY